MAFPNYMLTDTLDGTLDIVLLHKQIETEPLITTEFLAVNQKGSNFVLVFASSPSAAEQIECDAKVAAHKNLVAVKNRLVLEIKTHRDKKRLVEDIYFEYPTASGNLFSCSPVSQNNWAKLSVLDNEGLFVYPYTVTTYDERNSYNLINTADRHAADLALATAVITERVLAATYIANVLGAIDSESAVAVAMAYFAL